MTTPGEEVMEGQVPRSQGGYAFTRILRALREFFTPPRDLQAGMRWLMMLQGCLHLAIAAAFLATPSPADPLTRAAAVAALAVLAARWTRTYRRGQYGALDDLVLIATVAAISIALGPVRGSAILFATMMQRSLYRPAWRVGLVVLAFSATLFVNDGLAPNAGGGDPLLTAIGLLTFWGLIHVMALALENRQVASHRSGIVASAGAALAAAPDREHVVGAALDAVRGLGRDEHTGRTALALVEGPELRVAATRGTPPLTAGARLDPAALPGVGAGALAAGVELMLDAGRAAQFGLSGFAGALLVPLVSEGKLLGVLAVEAPRAPGASLAEALRTLATVAAMALARVALVEERVRAAEALHRTELGLREAQKMDAIGRLAGGVAHDFNNMLAVILTYSSMLRDEMKPDDPLRDLAQEIQHTGERAAALTRQLLLFSRRQPMGDGPTDLNEVVRGMEKMLRRLIGSDVQLDTVLDPAAGWVKSDAGQLEQVLMNLAVNARDAMPGGGRLTIETHDRPGADGEGHGLELVVTDNGTGMSDEVRARIFEPFFTTKEVGKGTGLGLATVYGIVTRAGGTIEVESALGRGTTFRIRVPSLAGATAAASAAASSASDHARGDETVLLVDDDDAVREAARRALHRRGYAVLEARNAGEALILCERSGEDIDLMLTDVVMPFMNGPALAARALALNPDLRVMFMSGHDEAAAQEARDPARYLEKPFTPESLAGAVRRVLDGGGPARAAA